MPSVRALSSKGKISFELLVSYAESDDNESLDFTPENIDFVKKSRLNKPSVLSISIIACVPVKLYYFGDGITNGPANKTMIHPGLPLAPSSLYSVTYKAYMDLDCLIHKVIAPAVIRYESRERKYILTTSEPNKAVTIIDHFELRVQKNQALISRSISLLDFLSLNEYTVYLRPSHASYSHTSSLIMRTFDYPDIEELINQDSSPESVLDELLLPSNANTRIKSNIESFVASRERAVADFYATHAPDTEESSRLQEWIKCINRCQDQLIEVQQTIPELHKYNEQTRRLLMDVIIRSVCILNNWHFMVENTLCTDQARPPRSFTGCGPLDYVYGGQSLLVPIRDIISEDRGTESTLHHGAVKEGKDSESYDTRRAAYQALSEGHDLLQVPDCLAVELEVHSARKKRSTTTQLKQTTCVTKPPVVPPVPAPFVHSTAAAVLTTGQRYRVFHMAAPLEANGLPSVYYGGEYSLRVLRYRQELGIEQDSSDVTGTAGSTSTTITAPRDSGLAPGANIPDRGEIMTIIALLTLAGSGRLLVGDLYNEG